MINELRDIHQRLIWTKRKLDIHMNNVNPCLELPELIVKGDFPTGRLGLRGLRGNEGQLTKEEYEHLVKSETIESITNAIDVINTKLDNYIELTSGGNHEQ